MPTAKMTKPAWQRAIVTLSVVVTTALVLTCLYWMRSVFIPIAMAVFLAYVLAPVVVVAQRWKLGRIPAVMLAVGVALIIFLGTTGVVATQLIGLSETIAENKDQIKSKLAQIRTTVVGDGESRWARIAEELEQTIMPTSSTTDTQTVVLEPSNSWFSRFDSIAGPATEYLGQAAFAFILVVFILLAKEDLHDRILRILGDGAITSATRATGEASRRVSRYLFSQMLLNIAFGVVCAIGFALLGVPYAVLWGLVAALTRYIPYIGPILGAILPVLCSAALSEGWWQPVGILAVYLTLEVVTSNFIEPRLYGKSLGVSEVALLVSAAFWAFLWGPIGLILSGPITACLVMVGKHLAPFRPLAVLLGTEPPLTPAVALYQRLMARNQDEAVRVIETAMRADEPAAVLDSVVIPALTLVKQAKADGQCEADDERIILDMASEVVDEVALELRARDESERTPVAERVRVLACPAADEADRLSLEALADLLPDNRWDVKVTAVATLTSEVVDLATQFQPQVICIGALPPNGIAHVRYLCKRLRARLPDAHILVGRWGDEEVQTLAAQFTEAGASAVEGSLLKARTLLTGWLPVFSSNKATVAGGGNVPTANQKLVSTGTLPA